VGCKIKTPKPMGMTLIKVTCLDIVLDEHFKFKSYYNTDIQCTYIKVDKQNTPYVCVFLCAQSIIYNVPMTITCPVSQ
jgi:hypothetical protein